MSDKKYVVPPEMFAAAAQEFFNARPLHGISVPISDGDRLLYALDAAIRWLAENPLVPTEKQCSDIFAVMGHVNLGSGWMKRGITEWQRRMFLAPEPEVPDAVKDLLYEHEHLRIDIRGKLINVNSLILEAYNRGKASK